jgi:hypothetical protein
MKKLLSLAFVILSLATATAFAAPVTAPVDTPATATTKVASAKGGKHKHKKHKKQARKAHKKHHKHKKAIQ